MNEEFKQWKRILAHKKVLLAQGIFAGIFVFFVGNFIIHFIAEFLGFFKVQPGEGVGQLLTSGQAFGSYVETHWFWMLFPRFTKPGLLSLLLLLIAAAFLFWRKFYNQRMAFKDINKGTEGTSRWTTEEELNAQYKLVSLDKDTEYEGHAGVPVATHPDRDKVWIDTTNTNVEVDGATQTGKTQAITYPTIDLNIRAKIPDSMLINDIKGDIIRRTYFHPMARRKFHIRALNLIEPKNSIRINPLYEIQQAYLKKDYAKAQRKAQSLSYIFYNNPEAKEPVWDEGAMSIFESVALWLAELGSEFSASHWVNMTAFIDVLDYLATEKDQKGRTTLDYYFLTLPTSSIIRRAYSIALKAEKKQTSSFYMMVASKLKYFFTEDIKYLTSGHDLDFLDLAYPKDGKPTLLFVIFPYSDFSNAKLLKIFYSQLYQKLAEETTLGEGEFDVRLRSWMEEAQNVPDIEGMERYNNVGLGSGMLFGHVIQSQAGYEEVYGEKRAKGILGAAGNTYYIKGDDFNEAKAFAEKLGPGTAIAVQRSGDPLDTDKSYTEMEKERQLLMADELMRLMEGEWVLNRTKYTKDLKGNPIRPYPISAFYKEVKDDEGKITEFKNYRNPKFAHQYLFSESGGYFDTRGKKLRELELRENLEVDPETGKPLERVICDEDLIIPHDLLDAILGKAFVQKELNYFDGSPEDKENLIYQLEAFEESIENYKKGVQQNNETAKKDIPEEKTDPTKHSSDDTTAPRSVQENTSPNTVDYDRNPHAFDGASVRPPASQLDSHGSALSEQHVHGAPVASFASPNGEHEEGESVESINAKRDQAKKEREEKLLMEMLNQLSRLETDTSLTVSDLFEETYPAFLELVESCFGAPHARYIENPELSIQQFKAWLENAKISSRGRAFLIQYHDLKQKGVLRERR